MNQKLLKKLRRGCGSKRQYGSAPVRDASGHNAEVADIPMLINALQQLVVIFTVGFVASMVAMIANDKIEYFVWLTCGCGLTVGISLTLICLSILLRLYYYGIGQFRAILDFCLVPSVVSFALSVILNSTKKCEEMVYEYSNTVFNSTFAFCAVGLGLFAVVCIASFIQSSRQHVRNYSDQVRKSSELLVKHMVSTIEGSDALSWREKKQMTYFLSYSATDVKNIFGDSVEASAIIPINKGYKVYLKKGSNSEKYVYMGKEQSKEEFCQELRFLSAVAKHPWEAESSPNEIIYT